MTKTGSTCFVAACLLACAALAEPTNIMVNGASGWTAENAVVVHTNAPVRQQTVYRYVTITNYVTVTVTNVVYERVTIPVAEERLLPPLSGGGLAGPKPYGPQKSGRKRPNTR